MKNLFYLLVIYLTINVNGQEQKINLELKTKLDSIKFLDNSLRKYVSKNISDDDKKELLKRLNYTEEEGAEKIHWGFINEYDKILFSKIKEIIKQYGYPGKSLVGEPTNTTAWYVIQHSNHIETYFPIIQEAGDKKEIPMHFVATMQDRMLKELGKEQIYGTQGYGSSILNKKTGEKEYFYVIWPIKNPKKVNLLRKNAGFKTTIEEYCRELLDKEYKVYSLEDLRKMGLISAKIKNTKLHSSSY